MKAPRVIELDGSGREAPGGGAVVLTDTAGIMAPKPGKEQLHTCAKCQRTNFTKAGLRNHRCRPAGPGEPGYTPECEPQHVLRKTTALKPHPMLERIAMLPTLIHNLGKLRVKKKWHRDALDEMRDRWASIMAKYDEAGLTDRITITDTGLILDGRHRWCWAKERSVAELACEIVSESDAKMIIENKLLGRRHMKSTSLAYIAILMNQEVAEQTQGGDRRSDQILKQNLKTQKDLAAEYGVPVCAINKAVALFRTFQASPTKRAELEWRIWCVDEDKLGAQNAGAAGKDRQDQAILAANYVNGFGRKLRNLAGAINESAKLIKTDDLREEMADYTEHFYQKLPEWLQEKMKQRINAGGSK